MHKKYFYIGLFGFLFAGDALPMEDDGWVDWYNSDPLPIGCGFAPDYQFSLMYEHDLQESSLSEQGKSNTLLTEIPTELNYRQQGGNSGDFDSKKNKEAILEDNSGISTQSLYQREFVKFDSEYDLRSRQKTGTDRQEVLHREFTASFSGDPEKPAPYNQFAVRRKKRKAFTNQDKNNESQYMLRSNRKSNSHSKGDGGFGFQELRYTVKCYIPGCNKTYTMNESDRLSRLTNSLIVHLTGVEHDSEGRQQAKDIVDKCKKNKAPVKCPECEWVISTQIHDPAFFLLRHMRVTHSELEKKVIEHVNNQIKSRN